MSPEPLSDLDVFTDAELSDKATQAYENVMRLYRVVEANGMYGAATGDQAMRAALFEAAEMHSAICVELARRCAEQVGTDG